MQPLHKILIHAIWATKDRKPLINDSLLTPLLKFMHAEFSELDCHAIAINVTKIHIHCLFYLSPKRAAADVIKQVKGSSSHLVNSRDLIPGKFTWQKGYHIFSVSPHQADHVAEDIKALCRPQST